MATISQTLTLPARTDALGPVTHFVRAGAEAANLPQSRRGEVDLLVEEIFMNVARHSYPEGAPGIVTITYSIPGPGELAVEFSDQGAEFNPLTLPPPDLTPDISRRRSGGLGVFLLKEYADSLSYRREHGWNRLTFGISSKQ